uniref:Eukaryotic translation initiation factor 1b n=1 Tax=Sinocyclocheilus anshuiensis TaxID=1608454 RepID=A0A671MXZ2_9TELE
KAAGAPELHVHDGTSALTDPDPFADATKGDDLLPAGTEDKIHIRIQQRNGRKTLTTVQGISDDYDKKKLVKAFKKVFSNFAYLKTFLLKCYLMSNIARFYLIEICLQWYSDRAPRVWRGDSVTGGPKEEYLSVSDGGKVCLCLEYHITSCKPFLFTMHV